MQKKSSPFIPTLIILWSFFILVFVTKPLYTRFIEAQDTSETLTRELNEKQNELTKLEEIKNLLWESDSEIVSELQSFSQEFDEADMLSYLHTYAQEVNLSNERIIFRDISITPSEQSDIWFLKTDINLSALISSENALFSFLTFLSQKGWKYRFFIPSFQYEMNNLNGNFQVQIPLTFYHL